MGIYTYQLAHHRRLAHGDVPLIDTSVKTGFVQLAPRWDMVMGHKKGHLSDDGYTVQYQALLDYWWFRDPLFFDELLARPTFALGCYCKAGAFCHRHLLTKFLLQVSHHTYLGELTPT